MYCFFLYLVVAIFFFKPKTAYEMRISDWSSDVCSSDLLPRLDIALLDQVVEHAAQRLLGDGEQAQQVLHRQVGLARDEIERAVMRPAQPLRGQIGRASCRERVCQYV